MSGAVEIKIEIVGLEAVLKNPNTQWLLSNITWGIGKMAQARLSADPGPNAQPVTWQSEKQRIHYILMRKAAGLPLKYDRETDPMSQQLEKSWTVERLGDTDAIVWSDVTYAGWVQGAAFQQAMHFVTGWTTIDLVKRDLEADNEVRQFMDNAADSYFWNFWSGA
jgi:hypothetical protein